MKSILIETQLKKLIWLPCWMVRLLKWTRRRSRRQLFPPTRKPSLSRPTPATALLLLLATIPSAFRSSHSTGCRTFPSTPSTCWSSRKSWQWSTAWKKSTLESSDFTSTWIRTPSIWSLPPSRSRLLRSSINHEWTYSNFFLARRLVSLSISFDIYLTG